jgi:hypothetical protein
LSTCSDESQFANNGFQVYPLCTINDYVAHYHLLLNVGHCGYYGCIICQAMGQKSIASLNTWSSDSVPVSSLPIRTVQKKLTEKTAKKRPLEEEMENDSYNQAPETDGDDFEHDDEFDDPLQQDSSIKIKVPMHFPTGPMVDSAPLRTVDNLAGELISWQPKGHDSVHGMKGLSIWYYFMGAEMFDSICFDMLHPHWEGISKHFLQLITSKSDKVVDQMQAVMDNEKVSLFFLLFFFLHSHLYDSRK